MLRGEPVDVIECHDDSRSTLAGRFPRYENAIKNGAEPIVREGQQAVFVYRGQLANLFTPGHYRLTTDNLPILSSLQAGRAASTAHSAARSTSSAPGRSPISAGGRPRR